MEWRQLQCVWIPSDLLLGNLAQVCVVAGMRGSQTIVDQDGLWIEGERREQESVCVSQAGQGLVKEEL